MAGNNHSMYIDNKDINTVCKKIEEDRNLGKKKELIYKTIDISKNDKIKFIDGLLELHCAAVCFYHDYALIAKRSKTRKVLPEVWEFGCAKANDREGIVTSLEDEYKKDFGISIEVLTDDTRVDCQPIPLALYEVEIEGKLHKGLIVVALIKEPFNEKNFAGSEKHSEIRLVSRQEIDLVKGEKVEDFEQTLLKAS